MELDTRIQTVRYLKMEIKRNLKKGKNIYIYTGKEKERTTSLLAGLGVRLQS